MRSALRATGDEEAEDNDRELADEIADDDKNQGRGRGRGRSRGKGRGRGKARGKGQGKGGKAAGKESAKDAEGAKENKAEGSGAEQVDADDDVASRSAAEPGTPQQKKKREKLRLRPSGRSGCRPGKKAPKQRVSNQSPSAVGFCCFYLFFLPSTAASTMADLRLHVRGERKAP